MSMRVFASPTSWIEGSALRQLQQANDLPGMADTAGMPDLHPSKSCAVGAVSFSQGIVYPHLVGNDFGCGYSLFVTDLSLERFRPDRAADLLVGLDNAWSGDAHQFLQDQACRSPHIDGLGTVGGGNHFAELQRLAGVVDAEAVFRLGLDPDRLVLLVHSGCRSLGEAIYQSIAAVCGAAGVSATSEHFAPYLAAHDEAMRWAAANRLLIGQRLLACLKADGERVLDVPHNFVEPYRDGFLHRKGAAPSDRGLSPLPGSRGTLTYLLQPLSDAGLASLAHGAGRKASRSSMHDSPVHEQRRAELSVVVCGDDVLMREEHPSAYKAVDRVLSDLKLHGLATEVASFVPVLTYKSARSRDTSDRRPKRDKEDGWRRERRQRNRRQ